MHLSAFCKPKVTMANGVYELHIVCIECIFKKHTDNQTVDTIYDFIFSYAICIDRLTWRAIRWQRHERSVRSDLPACSGSQVSVLFQLHRNCLCRREFCSIETAKQAGRSERTLRLWRRQCIARKVRRAIHIVFKYLKVRFRQPWHLNLKYFNLNWFTIADPTLFPFEVSWVILWFICKLYLREISTCQLPKIPLCKHPCLYRGSLHNVTFGCGKKSHLLAKYFGPKNALAKYIWKVLKNRINKICST